MNPNRKTALAAGVLYVLTFVSVPTLALYGPVHDPNFIISSGSDTRVIVGCILELIVALAGIGTAVALYPVLKKTQGSVAIGLVGARILEAATIFGGVAFLLSVVTLHQSAAGPDALITGRTLVTLYDRIFLVGQSFMPAIDDVLLGFLLYRSRLVPRGLALVGLIGGPMLVVGDVCVLFGAIGQHDPATGLFAIPVAVFEFTLGIYLIVKGFKSGEAVSKERAVLVQFA